MESGSLILLRVTASHFKRSQVRRMVGAAVTCALGEADPARVVKDLANPTRDAALFWSERAAPSAGLFLERVRYKGERILRKGFELHWRMGGTDPVGRRMALTRADIETASALIRPA